MRVADTSLLYAFFNADDGHHEGALAALKAGEPLLICRGILQEFLDLVKYRQGKAAATVSMDYLATRPNVQFVDDPPLEATRWRWAAEAPLSFADAQAVALALQQGATLVTFDRRQEAVWEANRSS